MVSVTGFATENALETSRQMNSGWDETGRRLSCQAVIEPAQATTILSEINSSIDIPGIGHNLQEHSKPSTTTKLTILTFFFIFGL